MGKSYGIKNFCCFEDFSIGNLERVSLIAGGNNIGKTALLEAIFLHSGTTGVESTLHLNHFREYERFKVDEDDMSENIWSLLFYRYEDPAEIEI